MSKFQNIRTGSLDVARYDYVSSTNILKFIRRESISYLIYDVLDEMQADQLSRLTNLPVDEIKKMQIIDKAICLAQDEGENI